MKSLIKSLLWVAILAIISTFTVWYINHKNRYPTTDDAYVQANIIHVAAQISGKISNIQAQDHQKVEQNQPLLEIDPTPYRNEFERANAAVQNIRDELQAGMSNVSAARAQVHQQETLLELAKTNLTRTSILVGKKIRPQVDEDKAKADFKSAQNALEAKISKLEQAKQSIGALDQSNAKLRMANAQLATAKWHLDNTKISAPACGIISNFTCRVGDTVTQGSPLFTIVENDHYWISANFKETTLGQLKPGQTVSIRIDMYPGHLFRGEIQSISPTSGASMALLPPENASGNWVKVTQRFPVKIKILDNDPHYPLRIGASAQVTVDTASPTALQQS